MRRILSWFRGRVTVERAFMASGWIAALVFFVLFSCGCAAGLEPATGRLVVGVPVDEGGGQQLASQIAAGASAIGTAVGAPWIGPLAGGVATLLFGGLAAKRHADYRAAEAMRRGERDGWDEAVREGAVIGAAPPPASEPGGTT